MGFGLFGLSRRQQKPKIINEGLWGWDHAYLGAWTPHKILVSLEERAAATLGAAEAALVVQQPAGL